MTKRWYFYFLIIVLLLIGYLFHWVNKVSDKAEGHFGSSETKDFSINNNLFISDYSCLNDTIILLDNRIVVIGNTWTEVMWSYHNKKPKDAEHFGYNLHIEYVGQNDDFVFSFDLLDKNNQAFTNGMPENDCILHPKSLRDTIEVVIEEKNPDPDIGWMEPIITDTLVLFRKK